MLWKNQSKLFLFIFKLKACSVADKFKQNFSFVRKPIVCLARSTFMDSSIHQSMVRRSKWLRILPEQLCSQLIITLFYSDGIIADILYLSTQISGDSMFFPVSQNYADNSGKVKSEKGNICNRHHQRTISEMTLSGAITPKNFYSLPNKLFHI